MSTAFDVSDVERHGWRQGTVLGPNLTAQARKLAPSVIDFAESDWLIVTSHDCDVLNPKLEKEPTVELLRASVSQKEKPDKQQAWGRNPREMQLEFDDGSGDSVVLSMKVHERWSMPRNLLMTEPPRQFIPDKSRRQIAEWLAKRYIRAAFPSAFEARWRPKMKDWTDLLEEQSQSVQGIYLRLSTNTELDKATPYRIHLIVAMPAEATKDPMWSKKKGELESNVEEFWKQFSPGIECDGVGVIPTSQLTLADIEPYQRFDADWISFADDSPATPPAADMRT
jgi:hypothetical protein